jgi:hypothetical protein
VCVRWLHSTAAGHCWVSDAVHFIHCMSVPIGVCWRVVGKGKGPSGVEGGALNCSGALLGE